MAHASGLIASIDPNNEVIKALAQAGLELDQVFEVMRLTGSVSVCRRDGEVQLLEGITFENLGWERLGVMARLDDESLINVALLDTVEVPAKTHLDMGWQIRVKGRPDPATGKGAETLSKGDMRTFIGHVRDISPAKADELEAALKSEPAPHRPARRSSFYELPPYARGSFSNPIDRPPEKSLWDIAQGQAAARAAAKAAPG